VEGFGIARLATIVEEDFDRRHAAAGREVQADDARNGNVSLLG